MLTATSTPEEAQAAADQTEQVIDGAIVAATAATVGLVAILRGLWSRFLGVAGTLGPAATLPQLRPYRQLLNRYADAVAAVPVEFPGLVDALAKARTAGHERGGGTVVRQLDDPDLDQALTALHDNTRARLTSTADQLRVLTPSPAAGAATVRGIGSKAEASVAWQAARAVNLGVEETVPLGARSIFLGERDACVRCSAYIGAVSEPDGEFAPLLVGVLEAAPSRVELLRPPVHARCRCSTESYVGPLPDLTDPSRTDLATALAREAQRSIALGLSNYDSEPRKLRALDGLLTQGMQLPPSVVKTAMRSLEAGRFPHRPQPGGWLRARV